MSRLNASDLNYSVFWVDKNSDIIELLAAANHFDVANAAMSELEKHAGPGRIQLRYKNGIMKTTLLGGWEAESGCEVIWRRKGDGREK